MIYTSTTHRVFEDEILQVDVNISSSLLKLTWRQQPTSEHYRRGYRQAILLAIDHKIKHWITDSRLLSYLHMADQHWMYAKMRPLLKGGKLHKMAIVMQPETLMMTDRNPITENPDADNYKPATPRKKLFSLEFFLDLDSAQAWVLE